MRIFEWGQAPAEWAAWSCDRLLFRTPFGPWGDTINKIEADSEYNGETVRVGDYNSNASHYEALYWIDLEQVMAQIGQVPVLIEASIVFRNEATGPAGTYPVEVREIYTIWSRDNVTDYKYDKALSLEWYQGKEHIVRGWDIDKSPSYSFDVVHESGLLEVNHWPVTTLLARALRDNIPLRVHMLSTFGSSGIIVHFNPASILSYRPYLFIAYLLPIEFYQDDGSGNIDLSSPVDDAPGSEYYLGAVEPGQTGVAVKCHIKNYSTLTQQAEIFDDHPEYDTPITRIGATVLDYVDLADNSVSQKYTAVFYSSTQFEVKAETHRDNTTSLHPQINADPTWRGAVGSDFTAPSGGLTIPSAAWQRGTANLDEYEIGVRGNTTDSAWPADSNDQVELTNDDSGSPDAAGWRPCLGRRELTTAQVTVDATSKRFPTRKVDPVDWPVTTRAFVMNVSTINHGQISSVEEAAIGTPSFSGTGNDDITISGNYNGTIEDTLRIKIDGTSTPNTFTWSLDGGSTWEATGVDCSTSDVLLQDGIWVLWASTTGHVLDDYWDATLTSWAVSLSGLTANSNVYNAVSRIGTTLPVRDVATSTFASVDEASGVSESNPSRVYLESTTGFTGGQTVFIQSPASPDTAEYRVIDSVQSGQYIDLTVALTEDYDIGALVTVDGTGEASFWARPVAELTTAEQLKKLRFNIRLL